MILSPSCPPLAEREWIWRGMIGDWQDEWDLKRRGSDRSVNRHDTCRVAAYLNIGIKGDGKKPPRLMPSIGRKIKN